MVVGVLLKKEEVEMMMELWRRGPGFELRSSSPQSIVDQEVSRVHSVLRLVCCVWVALDNVQ